MVRNPHILVVVAAGLTASASARAEPINDFGTRGQVIISADRLSPLFSYSRIRTDQGGGDSNLTSVSSCSLLWSGTLQDFYDIPRAGVDYVLAPRVTIGGTLFLTLPITSTRATTQNGTTTSRDGTTQNAVGLGARAGYIVPLTNKISLWARGGLSYTREGSTSTNNNGTTQQSTSTSQFALNLEGLFVIELTQHFGLQLGPVIDVPLSGTEHTEVTDQGRTVSQDNGSSQFHIGITAGLLGWF